ncbi:MAG: hypothetical protein MI746_02120 [Pseudomonadales bacterium]|nr:hypothetical protein [Pseudomonadales bacterium]
MKTVSRKILTTVATVLVSLTFAPLTSAHFMVAQHGTLNFVDDGVFMVLSLPTSAFSLTDDDGDNAISMVEFNTQRAMIVEKVRGRINLNDDLTSYELLGLMLSPELDHDSVRENVSQVVVMGKFDVSESQGELVFTTDLFGSTSDEQKLEIAAKRKVKKLVQEVELTPERRSFTLLPAIAKN